MLWVEKYRPKNVNEWMAPERLKTYFNNVVEQDNIPCLLLGGQAGTGKTSIAVALCETLDHEYLILNASDDGNIDTLRTVVKDFASTSSFNGKYKVIILDEAEQMSSKCQDAFKKYNEDFAANCRFILISNSPEQLTAPIKSRYHYLNFTYSKDEVKSLAQMFWKRLLYILQQENVIVDDVKSLQKFVAQNLPDMRHILKTLENISIENNGRIPADISVSSLKLDLDSFMKMIKDESLSYDEKGKPSNLWYSNIVSFVEKTNAELIFQFLKDNACQIVEGIAEEKTGDNLCSIYNIIAHYDQAHSKVMIKQANMISALLNIRALLK